jgi:RHH-type proline utilization regulon transcriptional repressor/proline dehydrogenase/delta 1-pyrroline-5-carboxylate dehydrogenase
MATSRELRELVSSFPVDPHASCEPSVQRAVALARRLMARAQELQTPQEKRQQAELERMMHHEEDKPTLVQITDQAFRSRRARRAADQLVHILDVQGVPRFFSAVERTLLRGFQSFGAYLPGVAVPLVKEKMREETANTILPAEPELLRAHLEARRAEGVRMNVNLLGEALLGEREARERLDRYLAALQEPTIEVISVKISTIYSQIDPLAHDHTVNALSERLERLYRTAARATFTRRDGTRVPKFVYLDMEEYRDQRITEDLFVRTLSRPGLEAISGGIALQAYLPDAWEVQQRITAWARTRVAAGGAPVVIRLVKGANMEMERVESSLRGWPLATYHQKADTDANFKRMLRHGMEAENLAAVRLGVASHNLFDLAYGLVLAVERNATDQVQFEMLEGMANHQRRALFEQAANLLLYAPASRRQDFVHAIGYLIRRLDENTGPENFLRHTFRLEVGSPEWLRLEDGFTSSFERIPGLRSRPFRTQDRRAPATRPAPANGGFVNEPDTDWSLETNQAWAESIRRRWIDLHGEQAPRVPLVVDGAERRQGRALQDSLDPSRPGTVVARIAVASDTDLEEALASAALDRDGWRTRKAGERDTVLLAAAQLLRERRGDLMGAAMAECAKIFPESDPEVSEAVDFVEFYVRSAAAFRRLPGVQAEGHGVVVVVPPWNFPIAIPCGGVAAALAAGNTVIVKPSPDAAMTAYHMCACFWDAGVSRRALQFLPTAEVSQSANLVSDDRVDLVVLTGGTETAFAMLARKPTLNLLAETGGKNATIVTALSDRELAVKHVLQSAFGHAGQKCSATSLLVLEEEVFEDEAFRTMLVDGARSLRVGSAWDPRTRVGPLIRPPAPKLKRGLMELEQGESWALLPEGDEANPCLYRPGIRWNVQRAGDAHRTEYFGPVLAVMKARDLEEAIDLVNDTEYGLTSGLASLDEREQAAWRERVQAGNLYINRGTTGAIVLRQPFGGMKRSAFGPGIKAGGPNYVLQFMRHENAAPGTDAEVPDALRPFAEAVHADEMLRRALASYARAYAEEFGRVHDDVRLLGQDNLRRYLPVDDMSVRLHPDDSTFEILARVGAARVAGSRVTISHPDGVHMDWIRRLERATAAWAGGIEFVEEDDETLAGRMRGGGVTRLRYARRDRVPAEIFAVAARTGAFLCTHPVVAEGRVELLWYLREQSICHDYHRYGNLGNRADEPRAPVPGCDA